MATKVTALIYSGRRNPVWELTLAQEEKLAVLMAKEKTQADEKTSLTIGRLGYRGFMVETEKVSRSMPARLNCFDGIIDTGTHSASNFIDSKSELEYFLLESGKENLKEHEAKYIHTQITKNSSQGPASVSKSLGKFIIPEFDAAKWNNDPVVKEKNNCYNYANDKITGTFAQPGRGSGVLFSTNNCPDVGAASVRDGQIKEAVKPIGSPVEGHYIALVIWPPEDDKEDGTGDFHWYRLDNNGQWSHKPGETNAINTDDSGKLISDPETCNRGPYTKFCGYFHCIPSKTKIS